MLEVIAEKLLSLAQLMECIQIIEMITDDAARNSWSRHLALGRKGDVKREVKTEDFAAMIATASAIADPEARKSALRNAAAIEADRGNFEPLLQSYREGSNRLERGTRLP